MKKFTIFNQLTAMPKRLAMVLTLLFTLGVGSMWGETLTITGSASGISTTDGTQSITVDGIQFGGKFKQYATTALWFTSGSGYIYNKTSLGTINSITINYKSGGSASAKQYFSSGTSAITTYKSGTAQITTSSGGNSGTYSTFSGGFFNISISNKNLQATSIVIDYTPAAASCDKAVKVEKGKPFNGSFSISKTDTYETCAAPLVITLSNITPSAGYQFSEITQTGIGTGVTIDQANKTVTYAKNTSGTSTINVTFEQKQSATITLFEAGVETGVTGKYVGDSYTLPSTTSQSCGDLEFVGWSTVKINNSASKPASNYYAKGESVTLAANQTFHAVFAESGGTGTTTWPKTDIANINDEDEVVVVMNNGKNYALYDNKGTSSAPTATFITVSDNLIASPSSELIWVIGKSGNDLTFYQDDTKKAWLYCTATNNGVRVGTNTNKTFTIDASSGYLKHTGTSRYVGIYNSQDWRCYTTCTGNSNIANQTLTFYKKTTTGGYQNYTTECTAPSEYTVTFNANGHGTAPDAQIVASGQNATEPTPAPTATGYTFGGWYKESECTNKFDFNTSITADIPLYAKWTAIQTTITLNANGGSGNTTSVAATYDSSTLNPSSITNPTKTGHTFGGWYSSEGGTGSQVINSSGKLQANVSGFTETNGVWKATTNKTLYAKWTPSVYTITYKDQGNATFSGTHESGNPTQHTYGTETTLKGATKTGYTFGGWYKEATCTNKVTSLGATEYTANITLYAQWTANTYTVKFDGNGSDGGSMTNQPFTYGQSQALSANAFTRTNYAFKNWNTEADGSGTAYTDKQSVSNLTTTNGATITLYAQWTKVYTVTFYSNGSEYETLTDLESGATVVFPTTDPTSCDTENYPHFIGWTINPINRSTDENPDLVTSATVSDEDLEYHAVFAAGTQGTTSTKTDILNHALIGVSGTSYSEWSGKTATSSAVYAGQSAGGNDAIQLRSNNSNSGVITTASGGKVTKVVVSWNSNTSNGRTLDIYGKSSAYSAATDLYSTSTQGTKLGSIVYGTSTELTIDGDYAFIGLRSASGAMYLDEIQITWSAGSAANYTSFITTCCTSWTAPTLTYTTPLNAEISQTADPQLGSGTTYGEPTYTSSNPSVLAVDKETGVVTAIGKGTATITVTWEGNEPYCSVSATSNTITVNGSYSVTFHSNGGTGTMEPQKADPSTQRIAKLNKNEFTKAGYVFVGWKDASSVAYTDEQENITLTKNITLFAQWAPVVTLNDAGSEETTHPTAVNGTITLPDGANACGSYEFVGWTAVATGDWNEGINEPALVATTYTPNAPTTLYAVYKIQSEGKANAFKLSYNLSGTPWYVGTYGSSPYIKAYSTITADDAVTFYKEKIENNTEKYWVYFERYNSSYDETTKEYVYYFESNKLNTTNNPSEQQGWIINKLSDGTYEFLDIAQQTRYWSFTDGGNSSAHQSSDRKTFNLLPAVSSTYYAIPDCDKKIKITFETGNGVFIANTPIENPRVVTPGETITLPTCDYPRDGIEFIGWLKNTQQEELSDLIAEEYYYEGGEEYPVEDISDVIFYAYYKVTPEEVEFTGQDDAELKIYHYNGVDNYYYANTFVGEEDELSGIERCYDATTWKFTNVGNMQYYIQDETGKYLGAVSDNANELSLSNTPKVWNFTLVDGLWKIVCEDSPSRALAYVTTFKEFNNALLTDINRNSAYHYVTLGICPDDGYTTNPVLSQGFSITNTAMVTSASGQKVKATSALTLETRNIELPCTFTISAPNITFYDNMGAEVTELTSSTASEQFELYFAYKPTAENTIEYPTVTITDDEMKTYTIKNRIYARSLPNTFAIVAKVGNLWYALPSQGLNSTTPPAAYPVEVDNQNDPTAVTAVPANADWSLRQVYASSRDLDRFKTGGHNLVFVNNVSPEKALNPSSSSNYLLTNAQYNNYHNATTPGLYEWTPTTTDLETYQLTNVSRTDKQLNIATNTVFGVHATEVVTTEVRFLPIQGRYTPMAAQVVEWKENSIVIMYNGDPAQTASVSVNGGSAQETVLSSASAQRDIAVYELAATGLAANPRQMLKLVIGSEQLLLPIPYIIGSATDDATILGSGSVAAKKEIAKVADLVVLKDAKLTADGAEGNPYKFRNVTIYGGGKLVIPSDKGFGVASLTLRAGGIIDAGEYDYVYDYVYPQFELRGTFTNSAAKINYDYITDYDHWYHLVLPFAGDLGTIKYPTEFYGANVKPDNTGSWQIKRYAGEIRATGNYKAWVDIETEGETSTTAGQGYIFWGAPKKVSVNGGASTRQKWGIQRITMSVTAPDAMTAENGDKAISELSSYANVPNNSGKDNDQGWNLIGNPYMVNLTDMATTGLHACKLVEVIDPTTGKWNGKWEWNDETNIRYLTIPSEHFDTYTAKTVSAAKADNNLVPGHVFFVQLEGEADGVTFAAANRASLMPALLAENNDKPVDIETGIILSNETLQDEVNFWIKDGKTNNYEYNADYPKTPNNNHFNIYGVHTNGDLSWVATSPEYAAESMPIGYQVPAAGTFTLSVSETYYSENLQALFVTDHEASPEVTTNLVDEDYTFYVNQAETNNTRFTVSIILKPEKENTPTGVDNINTKANQPIKFLYQDKIYILRNGMIYDTTGKQVITINK